jgi:hypothetical protein
LELLEIVKIYKSFFNSKAQDLPFRVKCHKLCMGDAIRVNGCRPLKYWTLVLACSKSTLSESSRKLFYERLFAGICLKDNTCIKLVKQISLYTFLKKPKDVNNIIMEVKMINALLIHYQMLDKIASYT